ncbi:hypothetical protein NECAME_11820 [Necator americanus]|uniref:Uncharacterized protein n=1 Tax=Necator americanus TaxID=51031 RepID=W2T2U0_NECAM|nr:hypothetical protein NECAME_11820 [Necator americanus]ETN76228.1 hypothetical protein NECAME_11820 [Necator americanus]
MDQVEATSGEEQVSIHSYGKRKRKRKRKRYGCSVKGLSYQIEEVGKEDKGRILSYQIKEAWGVDQGQMEVALGKDKEDQDLSYQIKEDGVDQEEDQEEDQEDGFNRRSQQQLTAFENRLSELFTSIYVTSSSENHFIK